jgi:hypothetical protein
MLIENGEADLILEQYPDVVDGGENGLEVVVQNDRYTLVRVVDPATSGSGDDEDNGSLEDEAGTSSSSSSSSSDTTTTEEGGSVGSAPPITGAPTDDTDTPGEAPTGAPSSGE